jgi:hypothetical protein
MEARVAERHRVLREGEGVTALLGHAPDLLGAQLGVPDGRQRHGDEAAGVGGAPLVDVPVVVGAHQGQEEVGVLGGEQPGGEAGEGGEVHLGEDAAGVHVGDAFVDVVAAGPDLVQALRLHAVLLLGPSGDRVERDVADGVVPELPYVAAVLAVDQARRVLLVAGRQVVREQVWRLDDVVVDADEDHVIATCRPVGTRPSVPTGGRDAEAPRRQPG